MRSRNSALREGSATEGSEGRLKSEFGVRRKMLVAMYVQPDRGER